MIEWIHSHRSAVCASQPAEAGAECTDPLTALACVSPVYTELAVFDGDATARASTRPGRVRPARRPAPTPASLRPVRPTRLACNQTEDRSEKNVEPTRTEICHY
jgi:hypothetical protein